MGHTTPRAAAPWVLEREVIASVSLPLNLDQNTAHPFHAVLSEIRRGAKRWARELPVLRFAVQALAAHPF